MLRTNIKYTITIVSTVSTAVRTQLIGSKPYCRFHVTVHNSTSTLSALKTRKVGAARFQKPY